ncbi:uncharacterized protein LOC116432095 isoform X1 [Nomia melanderi]|uniref:uncharacterized protein LOC116432095 isoform X1 n=1 Tax=Nomia melanderi TaxID=2448451 RepID=UPI003FCE8010
MMQVNSQERENIETTILALVLSQKRGCSLPQLCKEYYDLEGERIPWKRLGHSSLMKFLQSMSKTIEIENRNNETFLHGIPSDKSKHVSKLIAGQKDQKPILGRKVYKPSHYYPNTAPFKVRIPAEILNMTIDFVNKYPNGVNKDYIFQTVQAQMPYVDITMSEMEEQLQMLSHKIHMYNNKIFPILNNSETSQLRSPIVTASGNEDLDNMYEYEDNEENDFKFISSTSISTSSPKSLAKTKTTSCFIKETISKCQNQNVKDEFNILTEKAEINEDNVYNLNHCNDNIEILTECNNNNNNNSDIDNENYDSKHTENLINDRIKFRLEKLIQNNPNGIRCAELPEKYLEEYKVCLNYTELGFSSVREFASQLPEIFHCVQSEDIGDFMLYFAKRDVPSNNSKEKHTTMSLAQLHEIYLPHEEDEALPTTLSIDTCNQLIPDGIVTIGESVGHLNVIDLVSDEKPYVEVVIAEVFTPAFFWIQLRKKQRTFKTFMDELHNFYVTKHQDYVVPPVILEKGLNCACVYNGVWHRGIIKSVKPDLQVTVMFYDYGTLKTYPPNAVCYLHRMFSLLPAQAIPCGLFNTRPYKSSKWTRNATHQFAVRTSNIPLIATVASMNEEDNSMMVTLTDTLEEEDVHINDWLVEQKLAEHGKMEDKVDMHNLLLYVEENLLFLPDQCYAKETNTFNVNNKRTEATCDNVPLISPQSTLQDKTSDIGPLISPQSTLEENFIKLPLQQKLPNELQKLEENLENQVTKNNSFAPFNSSTRNTNPFRQDQPVYDQKKDEISPEKLLRLWNEYLKLQIQINAIFEILSNKVMNNSDTKLNDTLMNNTLNIKDTTSHINNNISSTATNRVNINDSNIYPFNVNNLQRVGNPTQEILNNDINFNNCTMLEHLIEKLNVSIYSKILTLAKSDSNIVSQSLASNDISVSKKVPPGFENIFSGTIGLPESLEKPTNLTKPLKETNPFKIGLLNKLDASDPQEEICFNFDNLITSEKDNTAELDTNHDVAEKACREVPYNCHQCYSSCDSGNMDITDTKLPILNANLFSTDYVKTMDNMKNTENIIINSPSVIHNVNELNTKNSLLPLENSCIDHTPNNDNIKNHMTSWLPINSFTTSLPTMQDNMSIDEGYLTRPSTSHTSDRLSELAQTINDIYQYGASSYTWSKAADRNSIQSNNWDKMYSQYMNNEDTKITCNQSQLQNNNVENLSVNGIVESQDMTGNIGTMNIYANLSKLKNTWDTIAPGESTYFGKNYSTPIYTSLHPKIYLLAIELPKRLMHVFYYQSKGWLSMNEFVLFTEFKTASYMLHILQMLNIEVPIVNVDRTKCLIEPADLRSNLRQQTKNIMYSNENLQLLPIKAALKLLNELNMISADKINEVLMTNQFVSGSIMQEIWMIINAYGRLEYMVENREEL